MNESILTNCRLIFYLQFLAQKFRGKNFWTRNFRQFLKQNDFRDLGKLKIRHKSFLIKIWPFLIKIDDF